MSKVLTAVVHHDDADVVMDALREAGHRFTVLSSFGGLLGTPNVTLLMGVEDELLDGVLRLFEESCQRRELEVPLVLHDRLRNWQEEVVSHGRATILVGELDRIVQL